MKYCRICPSNVSIRLDYRTVAEFPPTNTEHAGISEYNGFTDIE
jgi:hypothetical protein